ncbi:flagellar motor protein MotB [Paenibacillus swuensis]|uniref:Flagellar motor protein MotB n=1 Tax=Paenibacillus swuensis TaxID=1178515 RepID=A0A172TFW3_9BACL|nr:flagellar motor protein MotB [Paenibacillus swuensis]ANE45948.1 flagellar motor protein MotB [Paenibacillus swuensis]
MSKRHRKEEHEEHADESWLIPYADLLTLLLALFIVLFASSQIDSAKFDEMSKAFSIALNPGNGVLDQPTVVKEGTSNLKKKSDDADKEKKAEDQERFKKETEDLQRLKQKLDKYIKDNGLSTQLVTKLNHSELIIRISDNALYPSGSASLKPEARNLAVAISTMLGQYPEYEVIVAGHTDDQPISNFEFDSNWNLSFERALNFMKILFSNNKLDPKQFSPIGYGEQRPIASNDTDLGRAKNRRVEVAIVRKFQETGDVQDTPTAPNTP